MPPPTNETSAPTVTSLPARLTNIFVFPGEVFTEVAGSPHKAANWLVPLVLVCLATIVSVWVLFSQEAFLQQLHENQEKAMQAQVDAGKMTRQQADQAMQAVEKFTSPIFLKITGSVSAIFGSVIGLFLYSFLLWLVGAQILKGNFHFLKAVEVCGLARMIGVLGKIVGTLIVVGTGKMQATLGPALFVKDFNPSSAVHQLLGAINLMTLWELAVLALGLAVLSRISFRKAALWVFVPWAVCISGIILISQLLVGLAAKLH